MHFWSKLITVSYGLFVLALPSQAHIWILDINDTITIRNDVDPQKTPDVVQRQLVAQNIFLKDRPEVSLEAYIKETIKDKGEQRQTYGNLFEYAGSLNAKGIISDESLLSMPRLLAAYKDAVEVANRPENGGFFPSLFCFIDYILNIDPEACISLQSFGDEIPLALKVLDARYKGKLNVQSEVGIFNDQNHLVFQGQVYGTPEEMVRLLKPQTVVGWKPNYKAGGRKCLFLTPQLHSFFYDDNADRFAKVYRDGQELSTAEGYEVAQDYIFQVNTALALTDDKYFIRLHKAFLANRRG